MEHHLWLVPLMTMLPLLALAAEPKIAVTVYNEDLALVRETRTLKLVKGVQSYAFSGVAAQIDATSVHFRAVDAAAGITLLEQDYEFDLVGTERLLQKYIDEQVIVTAENGAVHSGQLLSAQDGDVVLLDGAGKVQALKAAKLQSIEFPSLPEGLRTRPTLVWQLDCTRAGDHEAEISYLTGGLSWHAEYVAVLDARESSAQLNGWVSIDNQSGATFNDARVKLIAGDVHRVEEERPVRALYRAEATMAMDSQFEEKALFEYHLYTLQRPATLRDKQIKQLSLFPAAQAAVAKLYSFDGAMDGTKVRVALEFRNSQDNGLGMPLPKGKVRVYKQDSDGAQEFIGEDRLDHTPKDEKVRLRIGNAFDIVGERIVRDVREVSPTSRQETVQIKLRNHKSEEVTVQVVEHFSGSWSFIGKTPMVVNKEAAKVEFQVRVPADQESSFEYTVLYK
ncbi:MAG TPA: DUF4139 domain-containing protein [bacterium]|nr:DUF4139 domain-containing protein [bacterium]HPR88985.1 DUF4139 domain-containing protein [bacterium]